MSATKSKPAGRAVKVLPVYESSFSKRWIEKSAFSGAESKPDGHIVTGYTGSARRLKHLVEIAGMDENTMIRAVATAATIHREHAESILVGLGLIRAQCLSTAQGRKGSQS